MPCTSCQGLDRRTFLEQVVAILGVSGLAACSANLGTTPNISPFTVSVSSFPSLASVGGLAVVDNGAHTGDPIAVARIDATTFIALSLVCPHRGFTVQISGPGFYCAGHGATFSANGSWTGGQPTSNLSRYAVVYDAAAGTLKIS